MTTGAVGGSPTSIGVALEGVRRDVVLAWRRLIAAPLFTLFSVLTLAIGIGVTTTAYSFVHALVWRNVGVPEQERIVAVQRPSGAPALLSLPEFHDLSQWQEVFSGVGAWSVFQSALSGNGTSQLTEGAAVSGSFFQVLGVRASLGRTLLTSDDVPGAPRVVVLSDSTWRSQFGSDPNIVGKVVRMAGQPFEVVGVAPGSFHGISPGGRASETVWVPLASATAFGGSYNLSLSRRDSRFLYCIGRLAPERTVPDASAALERIGERFDAVAPLTGQPGLQRHFMATSAFADDRLTSASEMGRFIVLLPALVMMIACTNLANLVLSRGVSRQHEFAVRRALGASRARLIREQLIEGVTIAAAGGLGGLLVTDGLISYGVAAIRDALGDLPQYRLDVRIEPAVIAATGAAALLALVVSSLIPALQLTRASARTVLAAETGTGAQPHWRLRSNMIALQVGVSACLFLITAVGVTVLAAEHRDQTRMGLDRVALVNVPFSLQQTDDGRVRETVARTLAEVRQVPGIDAVAVSSMASSRTAARVTSLSRPFVPKVQDGEWTALASASPGAVQMLGLSLRRGRWFDDRDIDSSERTVILNESLARKLFSTTDPIGLPILARFEKIVAGGGQEQTVSMTVVGLTADTRDSNDRVNSEMYIPFAQSSDLDVSILARSSTIDVGSMAMELRSAVHRVNPDVAISSAGRADLASRWLPGVVMKMATTVAAALAVMALVLSMVGLYGVLSHVVGRRTREMGVRVALGADPSQIMRLVLRDGFRPIVEGLVIGLGVAAVVRMSLQPAFTKTISAFDPIAFALAAVPLIVAGAIACYFPARRASRVDPNVALRDL